MANKNCGEKKKFKRLKFDLNVINDNVNNSEIFDSINNLLLASILSQLNLRELLAIERVCKRWQTIIHKLLAKIGAVGTSWTHEVNNHCQMFRKEHCVRIGDIRNAIILNNGWFYDFTDKKSLKNLSTVFKKCPNVRSLHVNHSIISAECFKRILKMNPNIECIHLSNITLKNIGPCTEDNHRVSPHEWNRIGRILGSRLTHLSLNPHYEHRMNEKDMEMLLKNFTKLVEFRIGTNFERDVSGKFVEFLPKTLKLFFSLGRELSKDSLKLLIKNHGKTLTHLIFFSHPLICAENFQLIGTKFKNIICLRVSLSFNEIILSTNSPISKLEKLLELSVDLNTFSDNNVDDGLIWCIKDGLSSLHTFEVTRACLSPKSFDAIQWCLPHLKKLILQLVDIKCYCKYEQVLERYELYECAVCRKKSWVSLTNLKELRELQILNQYYRHEKPKPFQPELCEILPKFKQLQVLHVFRYDINGCKFFEALNTLLNSRTEYLELTLRSVYCDIENIKLNKKLIVNYDQWML